MENEISKRLLGIEFSIEVGISVYLFVNGYLCFSILLFIMGFIGTSKAMIRYI